jgi:hypothetical protein
LKNCIGAVMVCMLISTWVRDWSDQIRGYRPGLETGQIKSEAIDMG